LGGPEWDRHTLARGGGDKVGIFKGRRDRGFDCQPRKGPGKEMHGVKKKKGGGDAGSARTTGEEAEKSHKGEVRIRTAT